MILAEALVLRADIQKRLELLKQRLLWNAKVQEGQKPAEDPQVLMQELERLSDELLRLVQRINRTNSDTAMDEKRSLADALAVREQLAMKAAIYRKLAEAASVRSDIMTRSEVVYKGTVEVMEVQKTADRFSKEHRELDTKIQEMNWKTELQ